MIVHYDFPSDNIDFVLQNELIVGVGEGETEQIRVNLRGDGCISLDIGRHVESICDVHVAVKVASVFVCSEDSSVNITADLMTVRLFGRVGMARNWSNERNI